MYICSTIPVDTLAIKTPCKHLFHKNCLNPWTRKNWNCPYCSASFPDIKKAVKENDLQQFELGCRLGDFFRISGVAKSCVEFGSKELLELFYTIIPNAGFRDAFLEAITVNNLEIAELVYSLSKNSDKPVKLDNSKQIMKIAARYNSIEIMKFLFTIGWSIGYKLCCSSSGPFISVLDYAIAVDRDIEVVKFLIDHDVMLSKGLCDEVVIAIKRRRYDLVSYFVQIGADLNGFDYE